MKMQTNTCLYDIETTNLKADFGIILCAVVKPLGHKPLKIFRLDDHRARVCDEDKFLVKALRDELEKYEFLIGHNSIRFDRMFINTRLMYHSLEPMHEKLHIDTLTIARSCMRISYRSLERIIQFLDIPEKKTPLDPKQWRHAMLGDRNAMDAVVKHCIQDVKSLELVYDRLKPFMKSVRRR